MPSPEPDRAWVRDAIAAIRAEAAEAADTPLFELELEQLPGITLLWKDESSHASGSLKHRLARSLFLHGLASGAIGRDTHLVEASSGSTAISEAWFARLIGLAYTAVVPEATAPGKIAAIREVGGNVEIAPHGTDLSAAARSLGARPGHHFLDQYKFAERASDWRTGNTAEELHRQLVAQRRPMPDWLVMNAGTGGTCATIGRHLRYQGDFAATRMAIVDPQGSLFFKQYSGGDVNDGTRPNDYMEGIGRRAPSPSFVPEVIDRMICVPDVASIAAMRWLAQRHGLVYGPSTGINFIGMLYHAAAARDAGTSETIVSLACDSGERYRQTVYSDEWASSVGLDLEPWTGWFERFEQTGEADFSALRVHDRQGDR